MNKNDSWWLEYCIACLRTGSRVICNPPPIDTDDDYLLLVDEAVALKLDEALRKDGFVVGGSGERSRPGSGSPLAAYPSIENLQSKHGNVFRSYKKGVLNLIVTASEEYFSNFEKATLLAIHLNLKQKRDRVALFHSLCTDIWPVHDWIYIKDRQ